jgi:hypothetical protein
MFDEPHLTDRSGVEHTIGPGSFPRDPSQHEPGRAEARVPPDTPRTWQKPPHIIWRKLRAVLMPTDERDEAAYGSPSRYEYAREAAPAAWMYGVGVVLALLALLIATLSSGLFSKRDEAVALALQSSEGTITSAAPLSSFRATLPSIPPAPALPSPSAPGPSTVAPSASHAPSPSLAHAQSQPLNGAEQARLAARVATRQSAEPATTVPHPRAQFDLQVARANMDKNNLTTARAALSRVLAEQPNNVDAIKLNADLEDRELKRNALLLAARGCAEQDQWHCVWRNAGNALVMDASSTEAKRLVTQAMWQSELDSRTGATPPLGVSRAP